MTLVASNPTQGRKGRHQEGNRDHSEKHAETQQDELIFQEHRKEDDGEEDDRDGERQEDEDRFENPSVETTAACLPSGRRGHTGLSKGDRMKLPPDAFGVA